MGSWLGAQAPCKLARNVTASDAFEAAVKMAFLSAFVNRRANLTPASDALSRWRQGRDLRRGFAKPNWPLRNALGRGGG
jgi:hypothetical protein